MSVFLSVAGSPGFADCRKMEAIDPCEMAQFYAEAASATLPQIVDDAGLSITIDSAFADGPTLIVIGLVAMTKEKTLSALAADKRSLSDLTDLLEGGIPAAICGSPEGPIFLRNGGRVETRIFSADQQLLANVAVETCAGES
jgi:hypothetical protein